MGVIKQDGTQAIVILHWYVHILVVILAKSLLLQIPQSRHEMRLELVRCITLAMHTNLMHMLPGFLQESNLHNLRKLEWISL